MRYPVFRLDRRFLIILWHFCHFLCGRNSW